MRRGIFLVSVFLGLLGAYSTNAIGSGHGYMRGKATDEETGYPIMGAYIGVFESPYDSVPVSYAYSGQGGIYYTYVQLEQGDSLAYFYVSCSKEDYESEWWDDASSAEEADPVLVRLYQLTDSIDFALSPTGTGEGHITGMVTNEETTEPIVGAYVGVFLSPFDPYPVAGGLSTSNGYSIGVPVPEDTGYFYVSCIKEGYRGEWWDNAFAPENANTVLVIPGEVTDSVDFALTPFDTTNNTGIFGCVIRQNNQGRIEGAKVSAYLTLNDTVPVGFTYSGDYGYYSLPLPAGKYFLYAEKEGYDGEWFHEGTPEQVTVLEGQITRNINFTLTPTGPSFLNAICGLVMTEDNNLPHHAYVHLYIDPNSDPIDFRVTNQQGFYKFDSLEAGVYYVSAEAPPEFGKKWWDDADSPESADSITVSGNEIRKGINFYLPRVDTTLRGAVAGLVRDALTEEPIKGAFVRLLVSDTMGAYTNYYGYYLIRDVPVGEYRALATANGYLPEDSDTFEVIAGEVTKNINFLLMPDTSNIPGSISGRVVEEDKCPPIPGAFVTVFKGNQAVRLAKTDSSGEYQVKHLMPGEYEVVARAKGFVEEWWQEASSREDATPVEVISGQDTPEIDFTLSRLSIGGISGMVVEAAFPTKQAGIPFAWVWAKGINSWDEGWAQADNTGAYFIELTPGLYLVGALSDGYLPGVYPEPVQVKTDSITSGINIELIALPSNEGTISGIVTDDSTQSPIPGALVVAFADPRSGNSSFIGYAFTGLTGAYTITDVPAVDGEIYYVITFALGYIPEFYDGVYSWEEATLVGSPADGINFELGHSLSGPMGISGRITEGKGGVANAVIYATDGEEIVGAARSTDDGSYLLSQLPPGSYMLRISAVGYEETTYGPVSIVEENASGVNIDLQTTGIEQKPIVSSNRLQLSVAPSVASREATILYEVPNRTITELALYDISGRKLVTLVNGKVNPGRNAAILNLRNFAQGVYFIRLGVAKEQVVRKLIILR